MTNSTASFGLPDKEEYFRELKKTPTISWPSLGLFAVALLIIGVASTKAIAGDIPLWAGMIANGIALYLLFSIMHEALHRNVSTNSFINETFGRISLLMLIPAAPLEIARWAHFQHHR